MRSSPIWMPGSGSRPKAADYTTTGNIALVDLADAIAARVYTNTIGNANTALKSGSLGASSTWIVNLAFSHSFVLNQTYPEMGVVVSTGTTTSDTAYALCTYGNASAARSIAQVRFHPAVGGARLAVNGQYTSQFGDSVLQFRLLNDGTNLHYQVCYDPLGYFWTDHFCEASPSSLAYYGFFLGEDYNVSGSAWCQGLVYRNDLTALTVAQKSITGATNASPIVCTVADTSDIKTGDLVAVHGVGGNTNANSGTGIAATGTNNFAWPIQVLSGTTFSLIGSSGNAGYTSGGTATLVGR